MSYPQYIPTKITLGPIEPAFLSCPKLNNDDVIPIAWGPVTKVVGQCMQMLPGTGMCVGSFRSQDVNTRDYPLTCIQEVNNVTNMGFNPFPVPSKPNQVPFKTIQMNSSPSSSEGMTNRTKPLSDSTQDSFLSSYGSYAISTPSSLSPYHPMENQTSFNVVPYNLSLPKYGNQFLGNRLNK